MLYMFDGHNLFLDADATFGKYLGLKEFLDHWWKRLIVVGMECAHDNRNRCWTLAHNGTLFNGALTDAFESEQQGQTDSERILLYLIHSINMQQDALGHPLLPVERFPLIEGEVQRLAQGNKLNLLFWDSEYLYVHSNYANTLHFKVLDNNGIMFSTHPLSDGGWQPLPFRRLLVYQAGQEVYRGQLISQEYFDPEEFYEYKNVDFASL